MGTLLGSTVRCFVSYIVLNGCTGTGLLNNNWVRHVVGDPRKDAQVSSAAAKVSGVAVAAAGTTVEWRATNFGISTPVSRLCWQPNIENSSQQTDCHKKSPRRW